MKRKWFSVLAVIAIVILISPAVVAQAAPDTPSSCTWIGGASGVWTVGANWSNCTGTGGVPGTADQVSISGGSTITITDVPNTTIAGLSVSGNTTVNLQASAVASSSAARLPEAILIKTLNITTSLSVASGSALNMNGLTYLID